jgi:hypothetical protein
MCDSPVVLHATGLTRPTRCQRSNADPHDRAHDQRRQPTPPIEKADDAYARCTPPPSKNCSLIWMHSDQTSSRRGRSRWRSTTKLKAWRLPQGHGVMSWKIKDFPSSPRCATTTMLRAKGAGKVCCMRKDNRRARHYEGNAFPFCPPRCSRLTLSGLPDHARRSRKLH